MSERSRRHRDERTVLIYHDIRLKGADVEILRGPHWLNDQIIAFYFQYLQSEIYRDFPREFLFVSPQITQLIKMIDDRIEDAKLLLEPLHPNSKKFLFFPVNDNEHDEDGGTHWSLTVYSRPENTFYTFDSLNNRNNHAATKIIEVLRSVLNCQSAFSISYPSAQQKNFYDCGIYVICNVENITRHILLRGSDVVRHVAELKNDAVSTKRNEILEIIEALGGKGG